MARVVLEERGRLGARGARVAAGESLMHCLLFRIKRAHLSSLRAVMPFCEQVELTPARFDLLRAAAEHAAGTRQSRITKVLGLSRTAVSKMVRRLMELGLVTRARSPHDQRTFLVSITEEGERRMRVAYARLHEEQPIQSLYERCFGTRSEIAATAVHNLTSVLRRTAWFIGDWSCEAFYRSKDPDFA